MTPFQQALDTALRSIRPIDVEQVDLGSAFGRTLAEDVYSQEELPPFRNSAVDGYAVIAADTRGASPDSPKGLRVIGEAAAGSAPALRVEPGTAASVMTGAVLPEGADAMVMVEDTRGDGETALILCEAEPGEFVRPAGEDVRAGEMVLERGTLIGPAEMGMLAAVGKASVAVARRPRVSIITTGSELLDPGEPLAPGTIRNSNRYSIAGQALAAGCEPRRPLHAGDDPDSVKAAIEAAVDASDAIVTTGGISVGKYDYVGRALGELGRVLFWRVAIKPGKPVAFALVGGKPAFALPGNPTSSMVTFELFVRPALLAMLGRRQIFRPTLPAVLGEDIHHAPGRREFVRTVSTFENGRLVARRSGRQGSGLIKPMVEANSLLVIPEASPSLRAGDEAQVILLDSFMWR